MKRFSKTLEHRRLVVLAGLAVAGAASSTVNAQQVAAAPQPEQWLSVAGMQGPADNPVKEPVRTLSAKHGVVLPGVMPTWELPAIDVSRYVIEDQHAEGALRNGIARDFPNFHPAMGDLLPTADGGWLWVLDLKLPGAYGVRPHFSDMDLPQGAEMIVYDPQIQDNLPSSYRGRGPLGSGEFWAWTCWSNTARVEVYFPPSVGDARFDSHFNIDQLMHIYRDPISGSVGTFGERELGCHQDVSCFPAWNSVRNCVGAMQFVLNGGNWVCSGSMLNNPSNDLTPYFLTAHHCMEDNTGALGSLEVYWFFQTPSCNGVPPAIGSLPRSVRSTYVYTANPTDMSLVMIEGTVPRTLWWAGTSLNPSEGIGSNVVGIHHPGGAFKRYTDGVIPLIMSDATCGATGLVHGRRVLLNSGHFEGGSSGSPLIMPDGRVFGVDSCGPSDECGATYEIFGTWGPYSSQYAYYLGNAGQDDFNEPNDSCAQPFNLNVYTDGTIYSQVVKVNDEDWWRLTVPAFGSCSFRAHFVHAEGDVDIQLRDGCGGILAAANGTTDDESINWTNPGSTAREVYLRTYLFNDTRNIYYLDFSRRGPTAPSNNACSQAQVIPVGGPFVTYTGTTFGASTDGAANCGSSNSSPDVWYRFTPSCDTTVSIDTSGSAFDTVLSMYTGTCGALTQVACNDNVFPGNTWSSLFRNVDGGTTYFVRVAGRNGAFGNFNLNVEASEPDNDNCGNPAAIDVGSGTWSNCAATTDGFPDDNCLSFGSSQTYKDVWYYWYAPCEGEASVNTFGSSFDTRVTVYQSAGLETCPEGPNRAIACNDDSDGTLQSRVNFQTVPGRQYIIRMGSFDPSVGGAGVWNFQFTQGPTPADNVCAAATPITLDANNEYSSAWYTCLYSTLGTTESCIGGNGTLFNDRWFSITFPCDGAIDFNTLGSGIDTRIALYDACPEANDTALFCNEDVDAGNLESQMIVSVGANQQYYLRVGNWAEGASLGLSMNLIYMPDVGCAGPICDAIDFNNDTSFFDPQDIDAFLSVYSEGPCIPQEATCNDIDFNNDGSVFDPCDIDSFLLQFSEGPCTLCGQ
ncbi:MAG: hypothetical protein U0640_11600 [Phycisphaerales bacterium]